MDTCLTCIFADPDRVACLWVCGYEYVHAYVRLYVHVHVCVCVCVCVYVHMCMRYLVLIEEVLLKTVMFGVEQFEWRGIDQATRWQFELTKSKPGYAVHHNTRSLDIHTQNTYSSAPSRGPSCEPNYYQNRYKQHPKYGSCGLTLQIKRFRIERKI